MTNVVLTGFMASGKTAIGRRLARRLGWDFLDTDSLIEEQQGMSVSEIFAAHGEAEFRRLERELVGSLAPERPTVIATGGGTFVHGANRRALGRLGVVVCLASSFETLVERATRSTKRPLAAGPEARDRLAALLDERMPSYRKADVLVETDHLTLDQATARVLSMIEPRLKRRSGSSARRSADHLGERRH